MYLNIFFGNRAGVGKTELPPGPDVFLCKDHKKWFLHVSIVDVARSNHAIWFTRVVLQPEDVNAIIILAPVEQNVAYEKPCKLVRYQLHK